MVQETASITLATGNDFIELGKYTNNKNSIKVKFEQSGEDFNDWHLNTFGNLVIKKGAIDYSKYENVYRIMMAVEYEPSDLPMSLDDIDTLDGLNRNITDLKSFDYIMILRLVANRKFGMRLNEFVAFNTVFMDQFGQGMRLRYDNQSNYDYQFKNIIHLSTFREKIQEFSYGSGAVPEHDSVCPHCKQGWTPENLKDADRLNDSVYHIYCAQSMLYEKSKKEFDYIASRVFENYDLRAVKNQYGSGNYRGSWFMIFTDNGNIRIGWRKRVIQIEWLENYKPFKFDGAEEDVTKEFSNNDRYIHAWSVEKAIEYLRKVEYSIIEGKVNL